MGNLKTESPSRDRSVLLFFVRVVYAKGPAGLLSVRGVLVFLVGVCVLFTLSCCTKVIRPVRKTEVLTVCQRAVPEFPLVARVGVRLLEAEENKGAVSGLLFVRDRSTFKIALLGPFGSQKGEVYFLSGRIVAYRQGKMVYDTQLPIKGFPEFRSTLKDADLRAEGDILLLDSEIGGKRVSCRVLRETLKFKSITVKDNGSTLSLEGYKDGFYKGIMITKGEERIEIKVKEVRHKNSLNEDIFQLPHLRGRP